MATRIIDKMDDQVIGSSVKIVLPPKKDKPKPKTK